ncbi:MAG: DUF434 domain-containing protein [Bacteroidetes bacterium]|nr:DUF434 domain-containing protein [Bacteroidota bacterium]
MEDGFTKDFLEASGEYFWLLNRAYPQKGSLKMVGDKFMLSNTMRCYLHFRFSYYGSLQGQDHRSSQDPAGETLQS